VIGRLQGILLEKNPPELLLDIGGVGYQVDVSMSTFYDLPAVGETVALHIHQIFRDDAQLLFGFGSTRERALFRALLKVNGVGARVALAILSGMSVAEFSLCVTSDDVITLTRLPGIGKKTAERLIVEMRDKLPDDLTQATPVTGTGKSTTGSGRILSARSQASDALIALGYKAVEAGKLIDGTDLDDSVTVEEIIRAALKRVNAR